MNERKNAAFYGSEILQQILKILLWTEPCLTHKGV